MPKIIWDETYWLQRADEVRAICDSMRNHECRRIMGEMAESYERLASLTKRFQKTVGQGLDRQSPAPTHSNHSGAQVTEWEKLEHVAEAERHSTDVTGR